jgi:hypothetical protein
MEDSKQESGGLSYEAAKEAFSSQSLFESKTWLYSPEPFALDAKQTEEIEAIGQACHDFNRALETLYLRSVEDKNLLRNRDLRAPWVAGYLDRGKPQELISHARGKALRGLHPRVIRPDLLITDEGFILSELDSVPGGIGLTGYLNRLYAKAGFDSLIGADDAMLEGFYQMLSSRVPTIATPFIAIVVSDEAATYRPEMQWLARELRSRGRRVHVFHPNDVMPIGEAICVDIDGSPQKVDVLYRFWELFDLANVAIARYLLDAHAEMQLLVHPPMRHFYEEKLCMALFHHPMLEDFWRENLSRPSLRLLRRIIPHTWIMDPVELPPNAVLDAPWVDGKPIHRWQQLVDAGKKDRNLIIKVSGFHETAWGARSVTLGSDSSRADWEAAIENAIAASDKTLYILQTYHKPARLRHPVYHEDGSVYSMEGRMRLCPYYFVDDKSQQTRLCGVLATFCPADKKIIHGMKDAAMMPCSVSA